MPAVLLTVLRLIFLALVYLFVWQVARSIAGHLGSQPGRRGHRTAVRSLVVVRSESQAGLKVAVKDAVVLGRDAQADVLIEDPYVSDMHVRLVAKDGRLTLHDLGSTNGTYVNGRRITTAIALDRGDAVQLGKTILEVR